jgi:hypothetical protein
MKNELMNLTQTEVPLTIAAKTCSCNKSNSRKVMYTFFDACHILCVDKREIIVAQLEACIRLLEDTFDNTDSKAIEREIAELKMTLDLMP